VTTIYLNGNSIHTYVHGYEGQLGTFCAPVSNDNSSAFTGLEMDEFRMGKSYAGCLYITRTIYWYAHGTRREISNKI